MACGHSWPDVGEVAQGHTDNSRPLDPYREGTLMGRVRLACRGGWENKTPAQHPGRAPRPGDLGSLALRTAVLCCSQDLVARVGWGGEEGCSRLPRCPREQSWIRTTSKTMRAEPSPGLTCKRCI